MDDLYPFDFDLGSSNSLFFLTSVANDTGP